MGLLQIYSELRPGGVKRTITTSNAGMLWLEYKSISDSFLCSGKFVQTIMNDNLNTAWGRPGHQLLKVKNNVPLWNQWSHDVDAGLVKLGRHGTTNTVNYS